MIPQYQARPSLLDSIRVARRVWSGQVGTGSATAEFEKRLAEVCGVSRAICTTSGTTALWLALASLDLPAGAIVAFPAYTMLAGANAAKLLGLNVRLVDIDPATLCMDLNRLAVLLKSEPIAAVIYVDHNGCLEDVYRARAICDFHKIPLIEDACQAFGVDGAGLAGDLACLSFSPPKLITTGQGGAILCRQDAPEAQERVERILALIDHGGGRWRQTRAHEAVGGNYRLSDMQAVLGLSQLGRIGKLTAMRKELHRYYRTFNIHVMAPNGIEGDCWCAVSRHPKAGELCDWLHSHGVTASRYYRPVHHSAPYETQEEFPEAEAGLAGTGLPAFDAEPFTAGRAAGGRRDPLVRPLLTSGRGLMDSLSFGFFHHFRQSAGPVDEIVLAFFEVLDLGGLKTQHLDLGLLLDDDRAGLGEQDVSFGLGGEFSLDASQRRTVSLIATPTVLDDERV